MKEVKFEDLNDGMEVSCMLKTSKGNIHCDGKITIENCNAYVCQNEEDGAFCEDKKGYKFSWRISNNGKLCKDDYSDLAIEPKSIKERIEALDNFWDKEADDILQLIPKNFHYSIQIYTTNTKHIDVYFYGSHDLKSNFFNFKTQKNEAFKKALLWLFDKAGLLKETVKVKDVNGKEYEFDVKVLKDVVDRVGEV